VVPDELVLLGPAGLAIRGAHALVHPVPLHPRARLEGPLPGGVLLVGLAGVPPGDRALLEVRLVATPVGDDPLEAAVDLDDARGRRGEEGPVVADEHDRRVQPEDEVLEEVEAQHVEVVRRLVEQVPVVAGEEQPREPDPGRLPAGKGDDLSVDIDSESQPGGNLVRPLVEVRAPERHPPLEGEGVPVCRTVRGVVGGEGIGSRRHLELGGGDAGPPTQHLPHGLARFGVPLLRQQAEVRQRRGESDGPGLGGTATREDVQQGGLAGAVGTDEPDDLPRAHHEVEAREEGPRTLPDSDPAGLDGDAHLVSLHAPFGQDPADIRSRS
jgi:hypothetical protein